ncbi:MAG: CotH kinase family protein [Crocinitomicaceae bacterium]|nr:CotH kinase family protein [Flavobacteriales bacterium]NQZ34227.1 CotH kinase family protein [Crocinitomicaceae bacterium]
MKNSIQFIVLIALVLGGHKNLTAQSDFYAVDSVQEIRIYFDEPNWDEALDDLYIAGERGRLLGDVSVNGTLFYDAGIRYKGFSSYSSSRVKNPFNISLDYTNSDQDYEGVNKIKLSNVIQDPSFVREVLSYEIARKYMPASRSNYANVFVNDTLIGLYTNVEAVNKDFLDTHYGSRNTTFFKCNPESLDLNGANSNLSDSPGTAVTDYFPLYTLKSDDENGWFELVDFIDTLNLSPTSISDQLNIDRALWMHAFNYSVINFDSYIGYAQNYYIVKDIAGKFNPVLWDMNMSFASYRLTDASDNWDGFTINEAMTIDPLQHINSVSVQARPLIRNLLNDATQQRMYLAHMRTIIEENFANSDYLARGQAMQAVIQNHVLADTNKFYTNADFSANLTSTVSDLVDYPGITELMDARSIYLMGQPGFTGAPTISNLATVPASTTAGDDIWINAEVIDASLTVLLAYRFSESESFQSVMMFDDGSHSDGVAGDNIYGAEILDIANVVQYYIYAENDSAGRFSPERAAYEFHELTSPIGFQDLVINEVMAKNEFTHADQNDQFDDWIELFNTTNYKISTGGMYLSDDATDPAKWEMPNVVIEPGKYLVIWADEDTTQAGHHANFKLDREGDSLWLSYGNGMLIDSVEFGEQYSVVSYGRYPNGTGNFRELYPTFNDKNVISNEAVVSEEIFIYPNPAEDLVNIKLNGIESVEIRIFSMDGRTVHAPILTNGESLVTIDVSQFAGGVYHIHAAFDDQEITKKLIISNN